MAMISQGECRRVYIIPLHVFVLLHPSMHAAVFHTSHMHRSFHLMFLMFAS